MHEDDRQDEPEHRTEDEATECFSEGEDPGVDQHDAEWRTVPLRRFDERRGDVPDVRHIEVTSDRPLKGGRPGFAARIAAQQLDDLPENHERADNDDKRENAARGAEHGESVDTGDRKSWNLGSTSGRRTRPGRACASARYSRIASVSTRCGCGTTSTRSPVTTTDRTSRVGRSRRPTRR